MRDVPGRPLALGSHDVHASLVVHYHVHMFPTMSTSPGGVLLEWYFFGHGSKYVGFLWCSAGVNIGWQWFTDARRGGFFG